jgi:hypothetical protein
MGAVKEGTVAEVNQGRYRQQSVLVIEDYCDNPLGLLNLESNYSVMLTSGEKVMIHGDDLKPLVICPLLVADIENLKKV